MQRAWADMPNLLSLLVFFGATGLIFRSLEFALVVTASLGFHELGHAAMLAWYGLDWRITFGIVGAWTWSPQPDRERLTQFANVMIHLSGPLFSFLLALLALGVQTAWQPQDRHLLILASFSAQVGFLNLLPLGPLTDGGKIVQRMMASLGGALQKRMAILPVFVTALMLAFYGLLESTHHQAAEFSADFARAAAGGCLDGKQHVDRVAPGGAPRGADHPRLRPHDDRAGGVPAAGDVGPARSGVDYHGCHAFLAGP